MAEKKHGGAGRNQGRHKSTEPRNVVKQVRWTMAEWLQVVARAEASKMDVSAYQRLMVLGSD